MKTRKEMRAKRKLASRVIIQGTSDRPRFAVYRSNTRLSAQLIDDVAHKTILSFAVKGKNIASGIELGKTVAEKALASKISTVIYDRGGFRYHGVIKSIADAAREAGLKF
jgi:large subunit ribosomal protein L18